MDLIGIAGSLGVGAFLGTLIFIMYRSEKKATEERMARMIKDDIQARKENTRVLSELVTLISRLNGRR